MINYLNGRKSYPSIHVQCLCKIGLLHHCQRQFYPLKSGRSDDFSTAWESDTVTLPDQVLMLLSWPIKMVWQMSFVVRHSDCELIAEDYRSDPNSDDCQVGSTVGFSVSNKSRVVSIRKPEHMILWLNVWPVKLNSTNNHHHFPTPHNEQPPLLADCHSNSPQGKWLRLANPPGIGGGECSAGGEATRGWFGELKKKHIKFIFINYVLLDEPFDPVCEWNPGTSGFVSEATFPVQIHLRMEQIANGTQFYRDPTGGDGPVRCGEVLAA